MKIHAVFSENHYIEIELFDRSPIRKWFQHYVTRTPEYYITYKKEPRWKQDRDPQHILENWKLIIDTLAEIKEIGLVPNFDIPEEFNFDQQLLNKIHRFFTYNHLWWAVRNSKPNPFDPNFKMPEHIKGIDWFHLIGRLNDGVHQLERTLYTDTEKTLVDKDITFQQTTFWPDMNSPYNDLWIDFDDEMIEHCNHYREFIDIDNLVILNESILGKPFMRCFLNEDDPHADDITARLGSHGGFEIDLNGTRKRLYNSVEYNSWLREHNITNAPEEFVIGKISKHSFDQLEEMQKFNLLQVTFSDA